MGKGQRHSKNAGVMGSETLSYAERKALGFGTIKERVGKDSHGNFYDCSLTLQPVVDPMVTPDGHLYSKEAILENLLAQKKMIKRKVSVAAGLDYGNQHIFISVHIVSIQNELHQERLDARRYLTCHCNNQGVPQPPLNSGLLARRLD